MAEKTAQLSPPEPLTGGANASEKTLLVLEAAMTHGRFSEVVEATGLAKATTHRILATLIERRFVTVAADGSYLPGPKILSLAGQALQRIDISAIAQPFVDALVDQVHCTVHVGVANGDEIVYLIRADSDKPYRMPSRVGLAIPMHTSGIGKVVLSGYTDHELERFVARAGLPARTPNTITTLSGLRTEVARIQQVGYSLDREENVPGVTCVAAPILDSTRRIKYGLSISTLTLEHTPEEVEQMAPLAIETAAQISSALGYTP
ncbi:IclR family transcriptional regulator [Kineosporia rhizophila]|uniref:IclR family transcriptional regulator n=1 Tax=Kineosporia TaxID=49184 RepID=UPI000B1A0EF0|nr:MULTISPECIES: IclR family transcriptional regulator [Kineosporia]MCE0538885.1 IclR family transcriptional regulator [Kineosporia rhizophila]GLY17981.1 transcriptional regulator [Kineosporia sp. NBRC 101677]